MTFKPTRADTLQQFANNIRQIADEIDKQVKQIAVAESQGMSADEVQLHFETVQNLNVNGLIRWWDKAEETIRARIKAWRRRTGIAEPDAEGSDAEQPHAQKAKRPVKKKVP